MVVKRRLGVLLAGTVLGTSFLMTAPAFADDTQLQQQINSMQQQLNAMQAQLAQTKAQAAAAKQQASAAQQQASTAQQEASVAQQNLQNIPPNLYNADLPIPTKGPAWFDTIHISLAGSFVAFDGVFRARNENSSGSTDPAFFGGMPLANSTLYYQNELRFSAQSSRIALKASGDIDPAQHLKAYWESDFQSSGVTANSRQTNGYGLRIRQAYGEYDNDNWGAHFSAGQMWSLATQNRVGILNGTENAPITIDAQYVVGFNYARQPAIRWTEDWNKIAWFSVAVESPQTLYGSNGLGVISPAGLTAANGLLPPPTFNVNPFNNCNAAGALNNTTQCSINIAPDIIEKAAFDPGWGHYELLGLQRWFTDLTVPAVAGVGIPGSPWSQKTVFGWGVGGSALVPAWPKFVDLQGSVLYGQGIGRYGDSQLPDVVIGPNGQPSPIREVQFLVGAVAHPWMGSDWYVYYGQEQTQRNAWLVGGVNGGWGNLAFPMAGCAAAGLSLASTTGTIDNATSFNGSSGTCTANVQRIQEITVGFWQDFYKGDLGRFRYGVEYEWVQQDLFNGVGSAAGGLHPNNNIVFVSVRYYPFN
jgi:outer membrane murein-binding lipoprotein Lpp